jgi:hypothetical protein
VYWPVLQGWNARREVANCCSECVECAGYHNRTAKPVCLEGLHSIFAVKQQRGSRCFAVLQTTCTREIIWPARVASAKDKKINVCKGTPSINMTLPRNTHKISGITAFSNHPQGGAVQGRGHNAPVRSKRRPKVPWQRHPPRLP